MRPEHKVGRNTEVVTTPRRTRTDIRRRAVGLLDQQLWCWGRDIARPEGNVLMTLGMCRHRSSAPEPECTAYTGRMAGGGTVWLWGFGLMYCQPDLGGVFLRRYGFEPVLLAHPPNQPAHRPDDLGLLTRPTTARQHTTAGALVRATAEWIAGYEHWVAETFGTSYRQAVLAARDKSPVVSAREMAGAWEHLACNSARLTAPRMPLIGVRRMLLAALDSSRLPARGSGERRPYRNQGSEGRNDRSS